MQRTKEVRFESGQSVLVDILSEENILTGRIVKFEGRASCVELNRSVALGAPVRIDLDDCMLLGEVGNCTSVGEQYHIQIELSQIIPSMTNLARLVSAVMSEGRSIAPAVAEPAPVRLTANSAENSNQNV